MSSLGARFKSFFTSGNKFQELGETQQQGVQQDIRGKRKRDPDQAEDNEAGGKRHKFSEMANIDSEEDVRIIPTARTRSIGEMIFNPIMRMFQVFSPSKPSKSNVRSRTPMIDLTQDEEESDSKGRVGVTKEDLNEEVQVLKHIQPNPDTVQASLPTRLEAEEEIKLLKVVNPKQASSESNFATSASGSAVFKGFKGFNPTDVQQSKQGIAKRFRFVTSRERQIQSDRNRPTNLVQTMKSGKKPDMLNRVLGTPRSRSRRWDSAGISHAFNLEARNRYSSLLMRNTSAFLPGHLTRDVPYMSLFGNGSQRSTFFTPLPPKVRGSSSGTPGLDAVDASVKQSQDQLSPGSGLSPVFKSPVLPPKFILESTSTPLSTPSQRKLSSLEEENKIKEVYSPGFLRTLNEKYSHKARDLDRKIRAEQTKKDFHSAKNEELYEDVNERILKHLRLTSAELEDHGEEEEEEVLLPDITADMEAVINSSLRARDSAELVTAHRIPITGKDIKTLSGLNWLNDEVINFYMQMIVERGGTGKYPKVHAFSTFFYSTYRDNGYARIKRWTKKIDIFEHSMVIVPVHLGMHWCMACIDMDNKVISYYDSMGGTNSQCTDLLFSYLKEEHQNKKGSTMDMSGWETRMEKDIPQQMNGSDCGMFSCKFAEYISRRAKITFSQQDMPYFRRRMVYEIVKDSLISP